MSGRPIYQEREPNRSSRAFLSEAAPPRPLIAPVAALMAGIWLSEQTGDAPSWGHWLVWMAPLVALAAGLVSWCMPRTRRVLIAAGLGVLALAAGFARHQAVTRHPPNHVVHALQAEPVLTRIMGDVVAAPTWQPGRCFNPFLSFEPPGHTRFVLALQEFRTADPPVTATGLVKVTVDGDPLHLRLGDRVVLTGKLYRPRGPQNPGETDWARWSRLQGIEAGLSVEGPQYVQRLSSHQSWLQGVVSFARRWSQSLLLEPFADAGSDDVVRLLDTMVLGQRTSADRDLNEAFLRAGVIHALSVSGFHVAALAGAAWWLTRRVLRAGSRTAAGTTLILILAYTLIAEPNAPILRAAVGGALVSLAVLARRPLCAVNWLAFSALCILAYNPLELFRPAFQLSFVQVLALVVLVPPLYRWATRRRDDDDAPREARSLLHHGVQRIWRAVLGATIVSVVAWLVATPLVLLHFQRLAPWGVLGTLLLSIPIAFIVCLSFVALLANLLVPPLGLWINSLLGASTTWLLNAVRLFERLPGAVIETRPAPAWLAVFTYALVLLLLAFRRRATMLPTSLPSTDRPRRALWVYSLAGAAISLAWLGWALSPRLDRAPWTDLTVLSVGNGSAALLSTPDRHAAVFDAGTDRNADVGDTVARALRAGSIPTPEILCLSHDNTDHYSGVPSLLAQVYVPTWSASPLFGLARDSGPALQKFRRLLPQRGLAFESHHLGDEFNLGDTRVEVLWPPTDLDPSVSRSNDCSLVLRLHAGGRTVLLPGDVERAAIRGLLAAEHAGRVQLAADVLVAPHHGSVIQPDTRGFLLAVNPEVIVVSSAKSHPKLAALVHETLGPHCQVVTTGQVGAVTVRISPGGDVAVRTPFLTRE